MKWRILFPVLALALSACGHVPVSTMYQLRKFDPATFEPTALRVAVQIHESFQPRPGGTVLEMAFTPHEKPSEKQQHRFVLREVPVAGEEGLSAFNKPGQRLHAFRLSEGDAQLVKLLQADTLRRRAQGAGGGKLDIQVSAKACRKGELPPGALLSTTYIRADASSGYLVLLKDVDLRREIVAQGKSLDEELPACG